MFSIATTSVPASRRHFLAGLRCTLVACFAALTLLRPAHAAAASAVARLDRAMITLGDSTRLNVSIEGGTPAALPEAPRVPGLAIRYVGQTSRTQILNGQASSSIVFSYDVSGTRPGDYLIPAINVQVGTEQLSSQPLQLSIVKADNRTAQIAFLTLDLPRTNFYVGEATVATVHLFAQGGQLTSQPQFACDGAIVGTNAPDPPQVQIQTNNAIYSRISFQAPLTFVKAGQFELTAGECTLNVRFRRPGNRDPFGFGDFFFDTDVRQFHLVADPVILWIKPVPRDVAPADFRGAVGQFSFSAALNTNVVTAGDPLTLTVRIAGTGALDQVTWSPPDNWNHWKAYPPSARTETADALGLVGSRVFEHVLVPESPDIKEVPPLTFSYFDPLQHRYQSRQFSAFPITVRPALATSIQPVLASNARSGTAPPAATADIVHIKSRLGHLGSATPPLLFQGWFLALQALPVALWLAARSWRKRQDLLSANPRLRRHHQVSRHVSTGLRELRRQAADTESAAFFETLVALLREQIGERLDLPASAITSDAVDRLHEAGLDVATVSTLRALFDTVDQARYAPQRSSADLLAIAAQAEEVLQRVAALQPSAASGRTPPPPGSAPATILLLGWLASTASAAAGPQDAFLTANRLYEQGKFEEATEAYATLLKQGHESPAVRFNLGNAQFRAGQRGDAIFQYRKALLLTPRDPDVQANLQFVRRSVGSNTPTPPVWLRPVARLSLDEWALLTSASLSLLMLSLAATHLLPAVRPIARSIRLFGSILLALTTTGLFLCWQNIHNHRTAIVVSRDAAVHYGPLDVSEVHFTVHDGMELRWLDSDGSWVQVADAGGRLGWIPERNVLLFPP